MVKNSQDGIECSGVWRAYQSPGGSSQKPAGVLSANVSDIQELSSTLRGLSEI